MVDGAGVGPRLIKCKCDLIVKNTDLTLTFSMGTKSERSGESHQSGAAGY
jgi:hypothetical protein